MKLNPLYYVVQGYRESFLSEAWFWEHGTYTLDFWVFTLVMFVIGSAVFRRLKPHFSDVLGGALAMTEYAIRLKDITKSYSMYAKPSDRFREALKPLQEILS